MEVRNVKVHVNMGDIVAAAEYLFVWNEKARHKYNSFSDWYNFIMNMIESGIEDKDEMCSTAGAMLLFEWVSDTNCHVDVYIKPQFGGINYVTYDVEV